MMRGPYSICLFLLLISIGMPSPAQTVDTAIIGTVTDSSGAVVPGATVTVTSATTGIVKRAIATPAGEYSVNYLIPGAYDLQVTANGFATDQERGIVLQLNQQAKVNVVLQVGGVSQVVEVRGVQPLLQTEDSSLGVVVGTVSAVNLPLNGRKFDDLAILTPGVTITDPDDHSTTGNGSSVNSYGSNVVWSAMNVDGITMVSNRHSYVNLYPSVDAVQEFKVLTGNDEAEYGGNAGALVNIQLKTGGNAFHGDLYEFFRNPALDARNFFRVAPLSKQVLKQNQFGGTFGGPIIRNRAFFFFSYEGLRSLEQVAALTNVLTPAEIGGNFSAILPGTQLVSPCTGLPYPGNIIPAGHTPANTSTTCHDGLDKVAQSIAQNYIPLPNVSQNGFNYADFTQGNESQNQYIGRVDHKFNDANQVNIHYINELRKFPGIKADPHFTTNDSFIMQNAGLQYVHTFSPILVNELRLGTEIEDVKSRNSLGANTTFTAASIGINGFVQANGAPWPPSEEGFPIISITNMLAMGDSIDTDDSGITYQLVDNVTWTRGKHALLFGTDLRHVQDTADTSNTPLGQISFTGTETAYNAASVKGESGNAGADFMIGAPATIITPEGVPLTAAREWRDFFFIQDNWKVTPKLTLNLGLRYDLNLPPHNNLNTSETLNWSTSPPALVSLPSPLWAITHKDFGPRVGFAYGLPWQSVIRGGYGISYFGGQFDNINILQLNPPKDPSFSLSNGTCGYCATPNAPVATLDNPVPASLKAANANIVSLPNPDTHPDLYLQTFNLTVSKQFWSNTLDIGYVGVKGTHQDTSLLNFNTGRPNNAATSGITVQQDRPYPTYGQMRVIDYHGASFYNGLQVRFEHRSTHNLTFTTAYAWSKLRDNQGSDINGGRNETQIPTQKVWANGLTDQRNIFTTAVVYQAPKLSHGNLVARQFVNGWGLNVIFQFLAGTPLFVTQSADGENNGNNFEYPDLVPGQPLALSHRTISEWFNTSAFTEAIGHYGNTPRNPSPLISPATDPLTLAITRSIPIHEQQYVEFRAEAFNSLNTPQFAAPASVQGSGSFGKITATTIDNREVQLVLKYFF